MPEHNEQKAPAFNPELKKTIAAFKKRKQSAEPKCRDQ